MVTDKDGKPVRVTNKGSDSTNNRPSASAVKIDYSKSDEGLAAITSGLPSGPGYAMAMAGQRTYDGGEGGMQTDDFVRAHTPGTATFAGASELSQFVVDGGEGYSSTTIAGGFTDGIIGWGRWTGGQDSANAAGWTSAGDNALGNTHYIVGVPTSSAEMAAKTGTVTYTGFGFTAPTSSLGETGSSSGISGTLVANFSAGNLGYTVSGLSVGAFTGSVTGTATISGAGFSGSSGSYTGCSSACTVNTEGFFIGTNAARAGLVYQFTPAGVTYSGAAVFK